MAQRARTHFLVGAAHARLVSANACVGAEGMLGALKGEMGPVEFGGEGGEGGDSAGGPCRNPETARCPVAFPKTLQCAMSFVAARTSLYRAWAWAAPLPFQNNVIIPSGQNDMLMSGGRPQPHKYSFAAGNHSARTVPVQCPYSAHTVPAQCPLYRISLANLRVKKITFV